MAQGKSGPPDPVQEIRESVAAMGNEIAELGNQVAANNRATTDLQNTVDLMRPSLAALAGLDGISKGVSELVGVLQPLRNLGNPPAPPEKPVVDAIARVRRGIGPEARVDGVLVSDAPIPYIGQPL